MIMDPAGGMDDGDGDGQWRWAARNRAELKLQNQNQYLGSPIAKIAHLQGVWERALILVHVVRQGFPSDCGRENQFFLS